MQISSFSTILLIYQSFRGNCCYRSFEQEYSQLLGWSTCHWQDYKSLG